MTTFIKAKIKKSDGQRDIDKYRFYLLRQEKAVKQNN